MSVEQHLRAALDQNQLSVAFQPKFDTDGRRIVGFEALARWTDPELGVVSPGEFIPVAEESGLVSRVGAMALVETCRRLAEWRMSGQDVSHVAVNVSLHQLRDPGFPTFVAQTLDAARLPTSALHLEITESLLATDDGRVIERLAQLRSTGIHIAMDDFGTGYSSLASLRDLPIDVLKIDRSFIVRCCDEPRGRGAAARRDRARAHAGQDRGGRGRGDGRAARPAAPARLRRSAGLPAGPTYAGGRRARGGSSFSLPPSSFLASAAAVATLAHGAAGGTRARG